MAEPSDHFSPGRSLQVTVVKSDDTPPFATVGISAASPFAIGWASGPHDASGSITNRDASLSFVPVAWCGLRIVGACQYRILSSPPAPRRLAPAADAGLAVDVAVPQAATTTAAMTAIAMPPRER